MTLDDPGGVPRVARRADILCPVCVLLRREHFLWPDAAAAALWKMMPTRDQTGLNFSFPSNSTT